jgi:hypothetical protein
MQHKFRLAALPVALIVVVGAVATYLASLAEFIKLRSAFVMLTVLLLLYLSLEVNRVRRLHPLRWMINPVVLCSFMTFFLGFGATNILYFLNEDSVALIGVLPEVTATMNKLMLLVVIGALAMWLGYWSSLAAKLTVKESLIRYQNKIFRFDAEPKAWILPVLILISFITRLIQVRLELFSYSSNYDKLIEAATYTQYLSMGSSLGKIALVLAALNYYSLSPWRKERLWFFGVVIYEIVFGFLSGFKSAVVLPILIVLLCQYLQTGRFSRPWLIAIPLALMIAFAVIEPFRAARNEDARFNGTSLTSIANTMTGSTLSAASEVGTEEKAAFLVAVMGRLNLTYVGSLGVAFADKHAELPAGSPEFLGDIILAPLHAWVPRFLWEGKSLGNMGLWYTKTVMGLEYISSTAMGIITNLYFAGGFFAVFCGMFFVGFIQRILFFVTRPWRSAAGGIVFMSMLTTIAVIAEAAYNGILVSLLRDLPLVLLLTFFLFKRTSQSEVK